MVGDVASWLDGVADSAVVGGWLGGASPGSSDASTVRCTGAMVDGTSAPGTSGTSGTSGTRLVDTTGNGPRSPGAGGVVSVARRTTGEGVTGRVLNRVGIVSRTVLGSGGTSTARWTGEGGAASTGWGTAVRQPARPRRGRGWGPRTAGRSAGPARVARIARRPKAARRVVGRVGRSRLRTLPVPGPHGCAGCAAEVAQASPVSPVTLPVLPVTLVKEPAHGPQDVRSGASGPEPTSSASSGVPTGSVDRPRTVRGCAA